MLNERSCPGIAANPRLKPLFIRPRKRFQQNGDGWACRIRCNHTPRPADLPSAGSSGAGPAIGLLIDPLKATKGRRMSKKTRKKSPKTPSRKAPKTLARKSGTGAARTAAKTPAKKTVKKPATASHKATSKKLKAAAPVTAKPTPQNPPVNKPRDANVAATPGKALLSEGAKAPAFQLPRDGGNSVTLADYLGKKLVVFFYPRADTPGCTR